MRIFLLDLTRELYVHAKNLFHGASFPLDKYIAGCLKIDSAKIRVNQVSLLSPGCGLSPSNRGTFLQDFQDGNAPAPDALFSSAHHCIV